MSNLGLTTTVMATWEAFTVVFVTVLTNGGPVALVYGFIFCFIGTMATCVSLAEYASMYVAQRTQCHTLHAHLSPGRQLQQRSIGGQQKWHRRSISGSSAGCSVGSHSGADSSLQHLPRSWVLPLSRLSSSSTTQTHTSSNDGMVL